MSARPYLLNLKVQADSEENLRNCLMQALADAIENGLDEGDCSDAVNMPGASAQWWTQAPREVA